MSMVYVPAQSMERTGGWEGYKEGGSERATSAGIRHTENRGKRSERKECCKYM